MGQRMLKERWISILQVNFNDYFYYDETSPSGLRWKVDVFNKDGQRNRSAHKGKQAGCLNRDGYYVTRLNGIGYYCHRVIWSITYGDMLKGYCIDHVDGNRSNNDISNLRKVTQAENTRNSSKKVHGNGFPVGVSRSKRINKHNEVIIWVAHWTDENGKACLKSFSESVHGTMAYDLALNARKTAIDRLNELGLSYHDNHGKQYFKEVT